MHSVVTGLAVALSVAFAFTGTTKAIAFGPLLDRVSYLSVPVRALRAAGLVEVAGAAGLLLGLRLAPVGLAAAALLTAQSALAVAVHLRALRGRGHGLAALRVPASVLGPMVLLLGCAYLWTW